MPQDVKNYVSRLLLRLTLMELFEFRFMQARIVCLWITLHVSPSVRVWLQTDPNWGNFLYDHESGKLSLIDFGAAIPYSKEFMTNYGKLVCLCLRCYPCSMLLCLMRAHLHDDVRRSTRPHVVTLRH